MPPLVIQSGKNQSGHKIWVKRNCDFCFDDLCNIRTFFFGAAELFHSLVVTNPMISVLLVPEKRNHYTGHLARSDQSYTTEPNS